MGRGELRVIIKRFVSVFKAGGISGVLGAVGRRIRMPHARTFPAIRELVRGRKGLEIGGPSPIFARGGLVPVYPLVSGIDNVTFATRTIWEGSVVEGNTFTFHPGKPAGRQIIGEGADLRAVPDEGYSFVLTSHMLEHTTNPLRALAEWRRVLEPGGSLILILPHRDGTFDHRRPITKLEHLREDFRRGTPESDLTHLEEILALHDEARDPGQHDISFRERAERNEELRSLHHHVFDMRLTVSALEEAGFSPLSVEPMEPYHVLAVARKPGNGESPVRLAAEHLRAAGVRSPFSTDREGW